MLKKDSTRSINLKCTFCFGCTVVHIKVVNICLFKQTEKCKMEMNNMHFFFNVQNMICTQNVIISNIFKSLYLSCTELSINQIFHPYLTLSFP